MVCQARATSILDAYSYVFGFGEVEEFVQLAGSVGGEGHGCLARAEAGFALRFGGGL